IHRRAARNHPLSERQKSANTTLSKVRARVEHVFGQQQNSMGGKIVRTIGSVRARFKIGMMNIRRLVQLERMAAAPASGRSRVDSVWHRAKDRADAGQASKRSPIGTHLGTSAATARSAKAEIAESEYCSRFPISFYAGDHYAKDKPVRNDR